MTVKRYLPFFLPHVWLNLLSKGFTLYFSAFEVAIVLTQIVSLQFTSTQVVLKQNGTVF